MAVPELSRNSSQVVPPSSDTWNVSAAASQPADILIAHSTPLPRQIGPESAVLMAMVTVPVLVSKLIRSPVRVSTPEWLPPGARLPCIHRVRRTDGRGVPSAAAAPLRVLSAEWSWLAYWLLETRM